MTRKRFLCTFKAANQEILVREIEPVNPGLDYEAGE
jgi:hypothetical protein